MLLDRISNPATEQNNLMSYHVISREEALAKLSQLAQGSSQVRCSFSDGGHSIFGAITGTVATPSDTQFRVAAKSDAVMVSLSNAVKFELSDLLGESLPRKFAFLAETSSGRFVSCMIISFSSGATCFVGDLWADSDFIADS
jgi:hypothetical protein